MAKSNAKVVDPKAPGTSGSEPEDDLVHASVPDGKGGATPQDWKGVRAWKPTKGPLWGHLDRLAEVAPKWLAEHRAG